jgi:hypothetical protein
MCTLQKNISNAFFTLHMMRMSVHMATDRWQHIVSQWQVQIEPSLVGKALGRANLGGGVWLVTWWGECLWGVTPGPPHEQDLGGGLAARYGPQKGLAERHDRGMNRMSP